MLVDNISMDAETRAPEIFRILGTEELLIWKHASYNYGRVIAEDGYIPFSRVFEFQFSNFGTDRFSRFK